MTWPGIMAAGALMMIPAARIPSYAVTLAALFVIAGGALVIVQGWMADAFGLQMSFLLTAVCELYVLFYALWGSQPTHALPDQSGPFPRKAGEG